MGCAYSDEELEKFEDVSNPMGAACCDCSDCLCSHWDGKCPDDCEFMGDPGRCPGKWEGADAFRDPYAEAVKGG